LIGHDHPNNRPGVDIFIEHVSYNVGQAFGDGIAEQIIDLSKGLAEQAQGRVARFSVTRSAQDMQPADRFEFFFLLRSTACRKASPA
jgi:hypothetical protein